ncbi:MAG: ribulose-phosphate 3-epimerase [Methanobacteriota archaeon]|nr:MAG: ribulose-phosphate 3-epimerase [Euryarchaeota archaeon]|tara:strand:- start:788 stop:1468 length:681 start_codon:yes stop_codon:yes gene_type:complete
MIIAPSILTADFCEIGKIIDEAVEAGIKWIHLDIMDGNWVINKTITFGPSMIKSIRKRVGDDIRIDCHLMITNAEETWKQFADAGVDLIIVHIEAVQNMHLLIDNIKQSGKKCGIVFNPSTPVSDVLPYLEKIDLVLVMSVVPGKGGQSFMPEVENKVRVLRKRIDAQNSTNGNKTQIMIDGGIKANNISLVNEWGVDVSVIGSGLINSEGSLLENLDKINDALAN